MSNWQKAVELLRRGNLSSVEKKYIEDIIDNCSNEEKGAIRTTVGDALAPRNLYYDYENQNWLI